MFDRVLRYNERTKFFIKMVGMMSVVVFSFTRGL